MAPPGNRIPRDPNALVGPAGFGTQGFLQPGGTWSYTVDFENDGSAAAQDVTVTEQLGPTLDWSTFRLGSLGFGPDKVSIPGGLTQYQTTVGYQNTDGSFLNVLVALDFNVQTGLLTVTFTSLDPATGEAPAGVFDGFLPPDNSSGVGEGFVQYTVQSKAGLATGATITQQAAVVFDTNAPLNTAPAVNTIDAGPPTSHVNPLPAVTNSSSFPVSWSGQDDAGGSGIASYTMYVSVDGGAPTPWLTNTTQTSATYSGAFGHSYGFYSVATDNVGHVQPTPTAVQGSTLLEAPPPPVARGITARLVNVKVRKKPRLMVEVYFADTGALERQFLSPFPKPGYKNIQVSVRDSNGDGVPDEVILTAKTKRGKTMTVVFAD